MHRVHKERFILKKLNRVKGKEQYHVETQLDSQFRET
jgi:hypothetical protein